MSSSEVGARSTAIAAVLVGFDVRPEDRVLILLPDGPGFAEVFSGITQLGAVALPVNPQLCRTEVLVHAAQTGAHLVVGWVEHVRGISDLEATPLPPMAGSQALWVARLRPP